MSEYIDELSRALEANGVGIFDLIAYLSDIAKNAYRSGTRPAWQARMQALSMLLKLHTTIYQLKQEQLPDDADSEYQRILDAVDEATGKIRADISDIPLETQMASVNSWPTTKRRKPGRPKKLC